MEYKDNEFGYQNREPVMPSVSDQGPAFTAPHYTYGQQSDSYGPSAETPVKADPQYASTYRPQPSAFAAENSVAEAAPEMVEATDTEPVQAETLDPAPAAATVAAAPEMA
ncbi:MAG: hypothetical protein K5707_01175, partial [Clostridia bacterium]|nr:hypothetical protein [Clostridia bacterium]